MKKISFSLNTAGVLSAFVPLLVVAILSIPAFANAQSQSCTGPGDTSCGSGNVCQQGSNGFYACFPATAGSGSCTGPSDTSCGAGNSCQQNNNGFYSCFPNTNASSGVTGSQTGGSTGGVTGSQAGGSTGGVTGSQTGGGTTNTGSNVSLVNPLTSGTSLPALLTEILQFVIQIGTIIIVLMVVYVGFKFVMAQGEPDKISEARTALMWTVIGALILLGAQAIASAIQATAIAL